MVDKTIPEFNITKLLAEIQGESQNLHQNRH